MSCWVVPMVAAEMWGVPVEQILAKVRSGEVPSKAEDGFLFIDVAPGSPRCDPPKSLRQPHPPTYVVISRADLDALTAIDQSADSPPQADATTETAAAAAAADASDSDSADESIPMPISIDDWRRGRNTASRSRRAPAVR